MRSPAWGGSATQLPGVGVCVLRVQFVTLRQKMQTITTPAAAGVLLGDYMGGIIASLRASGHARTSETYSSALSSFSKFMAPKPPTLADFTDDTLQAYEGYLLGRGLVRNSVSFYMRILRAVYNRAADAGLVAFQHPFRHVYTGVDRTVKRALSAAEVARVRDLPLAHLPQLAYARDMFMLSFYLRGMSFIDMALLQRDQLRYGRVEYVRRKTGRSMSVAWLPEMQAIVDRYPPASPYLLPLIGGRMPSVRPACRKVAYNINRRLKEVGCLAGIAAPLTMYVARHSWASAAYSRGVPLSVISEGMGHDSEHTTRIYLASLDNDEVDRANREVISSLG